jgi:hypothetical protein
MDVVFTGPVVGNYTQGAVVFLFPTDLAARHYSEFIETNGTDLAKLHLPPLEYVVQVQRNAAILGETAGGTVSMPSRVRTILLGCLKTRRQ